MEVEAFGRILHLECHICNEIKNVQWDMFKAKFKFYSHNKDVAIEPYLYGLEEKPMEIEV